MIMYIVLLMLILFLTFNSIWKKELIKSSFFTVCFIITLWINVPCFVSSSNITHADSFIMLPFYLMDKFGALYLVIANLLLGVLLFFQNQLSNKTRYSYKEIKSMYDTFGNDAVELYIIGKDLDFLYKEGFDKQTYRVVRLKQRCKLYCESTTDQSLLNLYKKVSNEGVEVHYYSKKDNITNLKGQIKIDQNGAKKAIFTTKVDKKFIVLIIDNQFLVSTIINQCNKAYKKVNF